MEEASQLAASPASPASPNPPASQAASVSESWQIIATFTVPCPPFNTNVSFHESNVSTCGLAFVPLILSGRYSPCRDGR